MDTTEAKQAIGRPQVQRLKDLGMGLRIKEVLGKRVLIKPVKPYTEMDAVEKKGLLYVPEKVKDANTPLPTTGVVVMLGLDLSPYSLREGDMVMFSRYAGMDVVVDQGDFKILDIQEIACVLEATNDALEVVSE